MNFIKTFLASLLAFVVGGIVLVVFTSMFFVGLMMSVGDMNMMNMGLGGGPTKMTDNTVLKIDLENGVTDSPAFSPISRGSFGGFSFNRSNSILQVLDAVEQAAWDDQIKGIYIDVRHGSISAANLEELRGALVKFKEESGKFVISYGESYSQLGYYLSSVADRVYMNPEGDLLWTGLSSNVMFYKGLLDKLGIQTEVVRHGSFKSAVEPFIMDRMSPENRLQTSTMLSSLWQVIVDDVAASRGIDTAVLDNYATDLAVESAAQAVALGLVDGLLYEDQVMNLLGRLASGDAGLDDIDADVQGEWANGQALDEGVARGFALDIEDDELAGDGSGEVTEEEISAAVDSVFAGMDGENAGEWIEEIEAPAEAEETDSSDGGWEYDAEKTKKYDIEDSGVEPVLMSLNGYISHMDIPMSKMKSKNRVAVIYADGDIMEGKSEEGIVGSKTVAAKLAEARKDKTVKAIVLRVNSPGGSALASEVMWREMKLARAQKPVVVSMGSVAASGGYYIACPADVIVADRMTLTGSIGVFGLLFDASKALKDKMGLTVDVVRTNPSADLGSPFRAVSQYEKRKLQKSVEQVYATFVGHVAAGRNMTVKDVDAVGGGRVWSGVNALENGLIDGFGSLRDAIDMAAQTAGVDGDYDVWQMTANVDNFSAIFHSLSNSHAKAVQSELGEAFAYYNSVARMLSKEGVQARVPYLIEIQ